MPTYDYECDKCKRTFEVFQSMTEPKFINHRDVTEGHEGLPEPCDGNITRLLGCGSAVIFKGTGWTPNFGGKTGQSMKKVDQALKAMGVEDASGGWTTKDDKTPPAPKKKGKAKYLGQTKI